MSLQFHIIPVTPFAQNCSIIWCDQTRHAAIIDAGGDIDRLANWVMAQRLTITKLLLTHGHIDHAGGARALADQFGVYIEGPQQEERFWLDQLPLQGEQLGFTPSPPLTPERWLEDNDVVTVGQEQLVVLHCPGHTPGHIVFYSSAAGLLIAGDVLFNGSIGRTDFPRGNHQQLLTVIQRKLYTLPDDTRVITGHGPMTTIGHEKRHNLFVRA